MWRRLDDVFLNRHYGTNTVSIDQSEYARKTEITHKQIKEEH